MNDLVWGRSEPEWVPGPVGLPGSGTYEFRWNNHVLQRRQHTEDGWTQWVTVQRNPEPPAKTVPWTHRSLDWRGNREFDTVT